MLNLCRYSFILSEAAEPRSEPPEAVYIRSDGSEDHSDLYQHTSEGVFSEEKLDHLKSKESEDQVSASLDNLSISEEPSARRSSRLISGHSEDVILGKKDDPIRTRAFLRNNADCQLGLVSLIEPTSVDHALEDPDWIIAMQEELNQFTRNDVWDLVPRPDGVNITVESEYLLKQDSYNWPSRW